MLTKIIKNIFAFYLCLGWSSAYATSVLPVDLTHMHTHAERVIYAECIDNQVKMDSTLNAVVTYTTFSVLQTLKGSVKQTITIKQLGGKMLDNSSSLTIPGVPSFKINSNYVLFLPKVSKIGFSSPIGLNQGSFRTFKNPDGNMMVTNGRNFNDLLSTLRKKNLPSTSQAIVNKMMLNSQIIPQPVMRLEDFMLLLKNM